MHPYHAENPRNSLKDYVAVPCNYSTHIPWQMQQLYRAIGCQSIYFTKLPFYINPPTFSPGCTMLPAIDGWRWHIINWTLMSCPRDEQITHHDWPFLYTVLLASAGRWPSSEQSNGHIPPPGTRSIGTLHNPADIPKLMLLVLLLLLLLHESVSQSPVAKGGVAIYQMTSIQSTIQCTRDFSLLSVQWLMMSGRFNEPTT